MGTLFGLIKLSFANLKINKLRSALTVIGMVFGTGAVIATLSSNEGAAQFIKKELESMGTNIVMIQTDGQGSALGPEHIGYIKKYVPNFRMLTFVAESGGITLRRLTKKSAGRFVGVDFDFFGEVKLEVDKGRFYDSIENDEMALVAVIGAQVKKDLFGPENAINQFVHLGVGEGAFSIKIIGVLKEKGSSSTTQADSTVFMPVMTLEKLKGSSSGGAILAGTLHDDEKSGEVREAVRALLAKGFPTANVSDARESIEKTQGIWKKQNLVGICLAMISLVTGGVGIMNIMLLSVAQRKREIGLRKAVGATNHYILTQFLMEAVMVCFLGGIAGILLGMFFGQQVAKMMGQWEAVLNMNTVVMALFFAVLTGVVFGLIPAMRASKLDPYEALRG